MIQEWAPTKTDELAPLDSLGWSSYLPPPPAPRGPLASPPCISTRRLVEPSPIPTPPSDRVVTRHLPVVGIEAPEVALHAQPGGHDDAVDHPEVEARAAERVPHESIELTPAQGTD